MKPTNYYESMDAHGDIEYGTSDAAAIIDWYRRYPERTVYVSVWNEESEEDFRLLNDRVDITPIIMAASLRERERV